MQKDINKLRNSSNRVGFSIFSSNFGHGFIIEDNGDIVKIKFDNGKENNYSLKSSSLLFEDEQREKERKEREEEERRERRKNLEYYNSSWKGMMDRQEKENTLEYVAEKIIKSNNKKERNKFIDEYGVKPEEWYLL